MTEENVKFIIMAMADYFVLGLAISGSTKDSSMSITKYYLLMKKHHS
jgi:hypothetical protein